MTNDEFCKIDTAFYGDVVDNIKQIGLRSFTGEELKEYVEAAINYTHSCETLKDKEIPTFEQYRNLIYKNKMHGFINKETSRYMDYEDMETRYNWLLKNL